jgi:hypothetical protein
VIVKVIVTVTMIVKVTVTVIGTVAMIVVVTFGLHLYFWAVGWGKEKRL